MKKIGVLLLLTTCKAHAARITSEDGETISAEVVSMKGFLATYSGRKSSVTRTDEGDGACEVLWVDELEILQDGTRHWHLLFKGSLGGIGLWLVAHIACFFILPVRARN